MQCNIIKKVHFGRSSVSIWPVTCASGRARSKAVVYQQ